MKLLKLKRNEVETDLADLRKRLLIIEHKLKIISYTMATFQDHTCIMPQHQKYENQKNVSIATTNMQITGKITILR